MRSSVSEEHEPTSPAMFVHLGFVTLLENIVKAVTLDHIVRSAIFNRIFTIFTLEHNHVTITLDNVVEFFVPLGVDVSRKYVEL